MIIYEDVFKRFQTEKIQYIIVGGIAANLLGALRATADLDILIDIKSDNLRKVDAVLRSLGYRIKQPIDIKKLDKESLSELVKTKNLKAINYYKSDGISEVDIIVDSPISFERAKKRAKPVLINKLKLPVISINDLIKIKSMAGRPIDEYDVIQLKKVRRLKS